MFKRYTKNPFDHDSRKTLFESEKETTPAKEHNETVGNYQPEQNRPRYHPPSQSDEYNQEVPPRIFDNRKPGIVPLQPEHETVPQEENLWLDNTTTKERTQPTHSSLKGEEPETTLGEGVVFKGELSFKRLLRIDGQFEGDLQSEGKLLVGPKGVVKSNITLTEAIIEGYVEGNLEIKERVELRGNAQVHGDILTKYLSVDEGVTIVGNVLVTPQGQENEANNNTTNPEREIIATEAK